MWLRLGAKQEVVDLAPGVCSTISQGPILQFRSFGSATLAI